MQIIFILLQIYFYFLSSSALLVLISKGKITIRELLIVGASTPLLLIAVYFLEYYILDVYNVHISPDVYGIRIYTVGFVWIVSLIEETLKIIFSLYFHRRHGFSFVGSVVGVGLFFAMWENLIYTSSYPDLFSAGYYLLYRVFMGAFFIHFCNASLLRDLQIRFPFEKFSFNLIVHSFYNYYVFLYTVGVVSSPLFLWIYPIYLVGFVIIYSDILKSVLNDFSNRLFSTKIPIRISHSK